MPRVPRFPNGPSTSGAVSRKLKLKKTACPFKRQLCADATPPDYEYSLVCPFLYLGMGAAERIIGNQNGFGLVPLDVYHTFDSFTTVARHTVTQWQDAEVVERYGVWEGCLNFKRIKNIVRDLPGGDGTVIAKELLVATRPVCIEGSRQEVFLICEEADF